MTGWIDWGQPARRVTAFVRAADFAPFASPGGNPRTLFEGRPLEILKASATGSPPRRTREGRGAVRGVVRVAAADEWVGVRVRMDGRPADAATVLTSGVSVGGA